MESHFPDHVSGAYSNGHADCTEYTLPVDARSGDRPKEECGVVGVYTPEQQAARVTFFSLFALQHRGQESAGIAVSDGQTVRMHRDMGLVSQVFDERALANLQGVLGIGHTRYSTTGSSVLRNAQPVYCQSLDGDIAVAHNGNLINTVELRGELEAEGEAFETTSDSEILARLLVRHMGEGPEAAVANLMRRVKGAYSVAVLTPTQVLGFRDPYGIRPMVAGKVGTGFMLASESCAFGPVAGTVDHELDPGELVIIDERGMRFVQAHPTVRRAMCLFEFIYFARPDTVMYGESLYGVRESMGRELAREHPAEADIVVPVPDSGIPAALGFAEASGLPFREGMMKSRYIHRTFISPDQRLRDLGVRMKLTPLVEHIRGQRIVLVDDSIVRATTTKQIVKLLFEAGAKEVHVRITAPPIKWPCYYGIDMARREELAAAKMSVEEIRQHIGASSLGYLSVEGASRAVGTAQSELCTACFTGEYPIPVPQDLSKDALEVGKVGEMTTVASDPT